MTTATALHHDERVVLDTLATMLHRDYARPVAGDALLAESGLEPASFRRAVAALSRGPRPYLTVRWGPREDGSVVEVRLTRDGEQYLRARD